MAARQPLDVSVRTAGDVRPLPVPVETALLRVAQSALANVAQHSGAGRARLTLTYERDTVTLDVVDDGRGFDPSAVAGASGRGDGRGFGLPSVRSRAHELGGTVTLETSPGAGTALAVTLPLPPIVEAP